MRGNDPWPVAITEHQTYPVHAVQKMISEPDRNFPNYDFTVLSGSPGSRAIKTRRSGSRVACSLEVVFFVRLKRIVLQKFAHFRRVKAVNITDHRLKLVRFFAVKTAVGAVDTHTTEKPEAQNFHRLLEILAARDLDIVTHLQTLQMCHVKQFLGDIGELFGLNQLQNPATFVRR